MSPYQESRYALTKFGYYADFITVPASAFIAVVWLFVRHVVPLDVFFSAVIVGALVWTLAEYWIHRSVFHAIEPFKHQHHLHHIAPPDYIGVAPLNTLALFALFGFGSPWLLGPVIGVGFFLGLVGWYFAYIALHDFYHHMEHEPPYSPWNVNGERSFIGRVLYRLYLNHEYHHRRVGVNFGVSSPLWDHVFGTYARPTPLLRRGQP